MNILPNRRGQVHQFISCEIDLEGKWLDDELVLEISEAFDALLADMERERSGAEETALAHSDIERVSEWRDGLGARFFESEGVCRLVALEVKSFALGDLVQVNLHFRRNS